LHSTGPKKRHYPKGFGESVDAAVVNLSDRFWNR
jgi:hypothetical protein